MPFTKKDLLDSISAETENYDKRNLELNPSFATTQPELLKVIDFYYMSKFRDGDLDNLGFRKVFYNIVNLPVEVASKMLNIDTKNIMLLGESWDDYFTSWIKSKELKLWMEEKYFGRQLNLYPFLMSKYGSVIAKKVGSDVIIPDINNIMWRPNVKDFNNTPIIEKHKVNKDAFDAEAKKRNWDNYKKVTGDNEGEVEFFEVYYPKGFIDSKYNYFIVTPSPKEVLVHMTMDKNPYKKLDWEDVSGRGLGRGQSEKLLEDQIYLNRLANYKAEGLHWSSKHMFQTRDQNVVNNLMTNAENGDVLTVNSEITPVSTEERNLSYYSYDEQRWENTAFRKAFTTEPVTGGRAPSGTPLGSTIIQTQMTKGYYDQKRQDLGSFIKEIIWDWILPSFEKQGLKDHEILIRNLITGTDDKAQLFFNRAVDNKLGKRKGEMLRKGRVPTRDEEQIMRAIISENLKNKNLKITKEDQRNLKHRLDITITGENIDVASKLTTLQVLIQTLGPNSAILQNKTIKKIFMKALDLSGFNPNEFDFEDEQTPEGAIAETRAQRGGSVPAAPFTGAATATLPQTV